MSGQRLQRRPRQLLYAPNVWKKKAGRVAGSAREEEGDGKGGCPSYEETELGVGPESDAQADEPA